jgi:O-antigen ligase
VKGGSGSAATLAALATGGAAFLVLLLYAPALQAPFLVPKFAALEVGATLAFVAFALGRVKTGGPRWAPSLVAGALLVVGTSAVSWAAATARAPGAPYAVPALARWAALFGLACGASVLDDAPDARQRVLEGVTIAAAAVAVIGLLQHLEMLPLSIPVISTPGSTFGNRNLAAEAMALALPLGVGAAAGAGRAAGAEPAAQRSRRAVLLVALSLELVYLAVTRARGAWLGAACGLAVTLWLARIRVTRVSRVSLALALGAVVVASVAAFVPGRFNPRDAGDAKRYSRLVEVLEGGFDARSTALRTRLGLWRRTVAMVGDFPWLGVGPGNWPVFFPRYAEPGATRDGVLSAALAPRQAHDDFLERAAETGIPGLLALGALGAGVAMAIGRRLKSGDAGTRVSSAAGAGAWASLGALCLASFPFEMPATIALAGLALGLVATDPPPPEGAPPALARPPGVLSRAVAYALLAAGLVALPCVALRAERSVRASRWLGVAERALARGSRERRDRADRRSDALPAAADALRRVRALSPRDVRADIRTAQTCLLQSRPADAIRACDDALTIEPYSPNAMAYRAASALAAGDADAARRDATRALAILHDYPLALDVHARAALQQGDADAAAADRLRLTQMAADGEHPDTARDARALLDASP